jgi:hypothetical protein
MGTEIFPAALGFFRNQSTVECRLLDFGQKENSSRVRLANK